jgi:hypothetical protein
MRQRRFIFLVVCLLMFCGNIFGQKFPQKKLPYSHNYQFTGLKIEKQKNQDYIMVSSFNARQELLMQGLPGNFFNAPVKGLPYAENSSSLSIRSIPQDFYTNCLGVICRNEWKFEKSTSIPLRFRLGSLEYVNYLEQKPNTGPR